MELELGKLVTADDIADALLRKVINWVSEKEDYTSQLKSFKEVRNKVVRLEEDNRQLQQKYDQLLKITDTAELRRLAGR